MIYFANPAGNAGILAAMKSGILGYIDTPRQGRYRTHGMTWCADNGCFGKNFSEDAWWKWLQTHDDIEHCAFATAPDVVGDAAATLERSRPWLKKIRGLGYPAAFVAQDGIETIDIPWNEFDALFIGGSTEFKLGPEAKKVALEAKLRGKWVHAGRVNSKKRYRYCQRELGCDSVDGTFLVFGPDTNLPRLMRWIDDIDLSPGFFDPERKALP